MSPSRRRRLRTSTPGRGRTYLRLFWDRAYRENITGLSAMVAYNLVLVLFPFALLALFIFGQVLEAAEVEETVVDDLQGLFPAVEAHTIERIIDRIRENNTTIGIAAGLGTIWIGASFWGAMDTAFCRIYHVQCRGWWEQKRFALVMLIGLMVFLAASVVIPAAEAQLVSSTDNLPFGLDDIGVLQNAMLLAAALFLVFCVCCAVYYFVPKGHVPWRGVWLGALFVTLTTGIANAVYPFYLGQVSSVGEIGGAIGFVLVALIWFYLVSLALLAGAVINALRYELHDTGRLATETGTHEITTA